MLGASTASSSSLLLFPEIPGTVFVASSFYLPRERKVYKLLRVAFRSEEVDVVEVGLSFYRFSLI